MYLTVLFVLVAFYFRSISSAGKNATAGPIAQYSNSYLDWIEKQQHITSKRKLHANSDKKRLTSPTSFFHRLYQNAELMKYMVFNKDLQFAKVDYDILGMTLPITESTMSHTASWVAKEINDGEYHLNQVKALGRIPDYSTVLDFGTNIGITAIVIAKMFPTVRVIGVEPMPPNFACALENIHLNGVADRVTILNAALSSDVSSPIKLSYSGVNSGGSSTQAEFHEAGFTHDFAIQPITVEEIVENFNVTSGRGVSFIKLDCEGCEFDIVPAFSPAVVDIFMKALVMGEVHERLMTIKVEKLHYVKAFFDAYEGGGADAKPWNEAATKTPPAPFSDIVFVPKDGDLIKTKGNSVFLVENGTRREFQSRHAFASSGYDFENVIVVESMVFNKIPLGEPLN